MKLLASFLLSLYALNSFAGNIYLVKQRKISGNYIFMKDISASVINSRIKKIIVSASPAIGSSLYLSKKTIRTVLQRYGVKDRLIGNGTYVYRPAYKVSPLYVKRALLRFLKSNNIAGTIEAISGPTIMLDKKNYKIDLEINRDIYPSILNLTLKSDSYFRRIGYRVYLKHTIKLPVAARNIEAGSIISRNMINYKSANQYKLSKTVISDADYLIGKKVLQRIGAGLPFYKNSVDSNIIKRGERVTLFFKTKNLLVRKSGIAIDSGNKGDIVSIRLSSKKIARGVAVAKHLVRLF